MSANGWRITGPHRTWGELASGIICQMGKGGGLELKNATCWKEASGGRWGEGGAREKILKTPIVQ